MAEGQLSWQGIPVGLIDEYINLLDPGQDRWILERFFQEMQRWWRQPSKRRRKPRSGEEWVLRASPGGLAIRAEVTNYVPGSYTAKVRIGWGPTARALEVPVSWLRCYSKELDPFFAVLNLSGRHYRTIPQELALRIAFLCTIDAPMALITNPLNSVVKVLDPQRYADLIRYPYLEHASQIEGEWFFEPQYSVAIAQEYCRKNASAVLRRAELLDWDELLDEILLARDDLADPEECLASATAILDNWCLAQNLFMLARPNGPETAIQRSTPFDDEADSASVAAWIYPGKWDHDWDIAKHALLYFPAGLAAAGDPANPTIAADESPELALPLLEEGLLHLVDSDFLYAPPEHFEEDFQALAEYQRHPGWWAQRALFLSGESGDGVLDEYVDSAGSRDARLSRASLATDIDAALTVQGRWIGNKIQIAPAAHDPRFARLFARSAMALLGKRDGTAERMRLLPGTKASVAMDDLLSISLDLSCVSLSDVLQFRREHVREFSQYARNVREFALASLLLPEQEASEVLRERRLELLELRRDLGSAWRRILNVGPSKVLAMAAGIASIAEGAPTAGLLSIAAAAADRGVQPAGWLTYLRVAKRSLPASRS